jgi:hypothetical protein
LLRVPPHNLNGPRGNSRPVPHGPGARAVRAHRQAVGYGNVAIVANVYGRFTPDAEGAGSVGKAASDRDRQKFGGRGAPDGAVPSEVSEKPDEESPVTYSGDEASDDSRGGTRTHGPGIMRSDAPEGETGSQRGSAP